MLENGIRKYSITFQTDQRLERCKILVTSHLYFRRLLNRLQKFNSVQQIVFDGVDVINSEKFQNIYDALRAKPEQVNLPPHEYNLKQTMTRTFFKAFSYFDVDMKIALKNV